MTDPKPCPGGVVGCTLTLHGDACTLAPRDVRRLVPETRDVIRRVRAVANAEGSRAGDVIASLSKTADGEDLLGEYKPPVTVGDLRALVAEVERLEADAARWRYVRKWFVVAETDDGDADLALYAAGDFEMPETTPPMMMTGAKCCDEDGEVIEMSHWPSVDDVIDAARRQGEG